MAITWPDRADEAIAGDLTAALAYVTPAGGAVVTAVAPIGLRDRDAGTVSFTTSLGFGKKLERIKRNPRVSLAYHAREHGFADSIDFVLVQGDATALTEPSREYLEQTLRPQAVRFMGPPKEGKIFWDRWLREYYQDRVPVDVDVQRVTVWGDLDCSGHARDPRSARGRRPAAAGRAEERHRPARRLRARRAAAARPRPRPARLRRRRRIPGHRARSPSARPVPTASVSNPRACCRPAGAGPGSWAIPTARS